MNPSLEECRKLCTAAEGYFELGLFVEGSKLLESLPPELKISARLVLQRTETPFIADVSAFQFSGC